MKYVILYTYAYFCKNLKKLYQKINNMWFKFVWFYNKAQPVINNKGNTIKVKFEF